MDNLTQSTNFFDNIKQSSLTQRVIGTIGRYGMLVCGDHVLVAVSGGADSTALLHLLYSLKSDLGIRLAIAHLNHGLRGQASDNDAQFVNTLANKMALPCHYKKVRLEPSSPGSLEEHGRQARYTFFQQVTTQHGYTKIALAHHMDDNAEAVLMHLLRGSGIRGLAGIPPVRDEKIIRPLIDSSRAQILSFLDHHNIAFVEDASNRDLRYERNRIRHHLLPLLRNNYNTNVTAALHRTAGLCWQEEQWLHHHLAPLLNKTVSMPELGVMTLNVRRLTQQPLAVQRRLVREGLRQWHGDLKRIQINHIDKVIELVNPVAVGKRLCLPNRIGVIRTSDKLCFTYRSERGFSLAAPSKSYCYEIALPAKQAIIIEIPEAGQRLRFSCAPFSLNENQKAASVDTILLDRDHLTFPLTLRNFRPGDRMQLPGMQGRQKIKKLFNTLKIPEQQRHSAPLLLSGECIVWVVGIRRSALAIPSPGTTTVIKVEVTSCQQPSL